MKKYSKHEIVVLALKVLPFPEQINAINTKLCDDAVLITWRRTQYKISSSLYVTEIENEVGIGSNACLLLSQMLAKKAKKLARKNAQSHLSKID